MSDESFSSKPLANRTILVACSPKKLAELASGIEAMGGNALSLPVIEVQDTEDKRPLNEALASLKEYAWIIFTSAYGVRYFIQRLRQTGIKLPPDSMPKICAIGPATAREVQESGYSVALIPEKYVAEGLVEALGKYHGGLQALAGRRVLIPRAEEARDVLPEALAAAGIRVDAVPCYRTVRTKPDPEILEQIRNKKTDMLVFTSSSAIKSFVDVFGKNAGIRMLLESAVAVLGPITGSTAKSFGKSADILPRENTIASLLEAMGEFYRSGR